MNKLIIFSLIENLFCAFVIFINHYSQIIAFQIDKLVYVIAIITTINAKAFLE